MQGSCGNISYELTDEKGAVVPAWLTVTLSSNKKQIALKVDIAKWTQVGTFSYKLLAKLSDYSKYYE